MKGIGYLRVSTKEQGTSGFGLEAQRRDIEDFCLLNKIELIAVVEEVASAKGNYKNRQVLSSALERCKKEKCCLIVSKLDRLSRDVESIANLVNTKSIKFIVTQLGLDADNFQIHLFATLAQKERDWIGQRTKEALKAKKEQAMKNGINVQFGNKTNLLEAQAKGHEVIKINADVYADRLKDTILSYQAQGKSLHEMAKQLNRMNTPTPRGGKWHPTSVRNLIQRLEKSMPQLSH